MLGTVQGQQIRRGRTQEQAWGWAQGLGYVRLSAELGRVACRWPALFEPSFNLPFACCSHRKDFGTHANRDRWATAANNSLLNDPGADPGAESRGLGGQGLTSPQATPIETHSPVLL